MRKMKMKMKKEEKEPTKKNLKKLIKFQNKNNLDLNITTKMFTRHANYYSHLDLGLILHKMILPEIKQLNNMLTKRFITGLIVKIL